MINWEEMIGIICDLYEELEISSFGFDLKEVCNKMGINLIPYSAFEDKKNILMKFAEDGFNLVNPKNNRIEIYYNDEQYPKERLKFTIPHEIGHIVFSHNCELGNETSIQNCEANLFANEFYIPQAFILHYKLFSPSDLVSNFGITYSYADVLLDKLKYKRCSKKLSKNELRLIEIFERNKVNKKSGR